MLSAQDGAQPAGSDEKSAGYGRDAGKQSQRGSFIRFQAKMVGSSPYATPAEIGQADFFRFSAEKREVELTTKFRNSLPPRGPSKQSSQVA